MRAADTSGTLNKENNTDFTRTKPWKRFLTPNLVVFIYSFEEPFTKQTQKIMESFDMTKHLAGGEMSRFFALAYMVNPGQFCAITGVEATDGRLTSFAFPHLRGLDVGL